MPKRRLLWQLLLPFVLLVLVALALVLFFTARALHTFYMDQLQRDLLARATLTAQLLQPLLDSAELTALQARTHELALQEELRISVISPSGAVQAESDSPPEVLNNHADRPEVARALTGRPATSYRFSHTLQRQMLYAAVPVQQEGGVAAVVRLALPATELSDLLSPVYLHVALLVLIIGMAAAGLSWLLFHRIANPLATVEAGAQRFAQGDFSSRIALPATREIAGVAEALNQMARALNERIQLVVQQRNEQDAILASMMEGVIAVDNDGRIISLNRAAAAFLSIEPARVAGQPLQTAVRNSALQQLVEETLRMSLPLEREILLHLPAEQMLQAHSAVLRDASEKKIGAVVVLNDVTRLRRLERVRRDFVANVSHELRTPITAIKGFIETLLTEERQDPENTVHFLEITLRQADRLNAIIEDLLILSRLEQENEPFGVMMQPTALEPLVRAAAEACAALAEAKQITLEIQIPHDFQALLNAQLMEQCLINLLDNALKYSKPGSAVRIAAEESEDGVLIQVQDQGCGISSEHLPRIFERFYRIDKSRSRKVGGTGLGLSIVKHIAQAHGGSVDVKSRFGEGSTFTVQLKKAPK